jgi:signal transduction histidine kinase
MDREVFRSRYQALLEDFLVTGNKDFLPAARQLGQAAYTEKWGPCEIFTVHLEVCRLCQQKGEYDPFVWEIPALFLSEVLAGWEYEYQQVFHQLQATLEAARRTEALASQLAYQRMSELLRSNQILQEEIAHRKRTERRLRRSRRYLLRAHRLVQFGFWIYRPAEELFWAHRLRTLFLNQGWDVRAIRSVSDYLVWVHPQDRGKVEEAFEQIRRGQTPPRLEYRLQIGGNRYIRQDVSVRKGSDSSRIWALGAVLDITELKEAELLLRRAQRIVSLGTFASGIAHEINNPLGSAMLAAETALAALRQSKPAAVVEECLDLILKAIQRCGRIVERMFCLARLGPGGREECDLNQIVSHVCEGMYRYVEERSANLEVTLFPEELRISACPLELELALANLVRNAIESRDTGTQVRLKTFRQEDLAGVEITDNGRGMDEYEIEHLFDPLFSTQYAKGHSGWGATLAYAIIREHQGTIHVSSQPGQGTQIKIFFPLLLASPQTKGGTNGSDSGGGG